jgi:nicotinamidase-related amidase
MNEFLHLDASKTALLVVDVQRALFTRPNPVYQASQLIQTIKSLIERARLFGVKVIYIQHTNQSILVEGTEGWQFHPDLTPKPIDAVVHKTQGNAFVDTTLQSELEPDEIQNLLVTGLVTHQCIRATCLGGLELGYRVFLIEGGHSNFHKDAEKVIDQHQNELAEAGVKLISSETITFN